MRRQRAALQGLIRDDAIAAVEPASGRTVRLLLSDIAPEEGVAIQLFLFETSRTVATAASTHARLGQAARTLAGEHAGPAAWRSACLSTRCPARTFAVAVPRTAAPPLIGVVTHELRAERAPGWAMAPGRRERDLAPQRLSMRLSYTQALQEAGAIAVVLPAHGYVDDTGALLDRLDGLLVSGGPDLDPALYGQERHPALGPDVDRVSDEYEQALLAGAAERDLPLLGICRGLQALNVSRGGTLHQHLPDRSASPTSSATSRSPRRTPSTSRAARCCTGSPAAPTSRSTRSTTRPPIASAPASRSAQGARRDRRGLWDPAARFCLGVQWHAELMTHRAEQATLLQRPRGRRLRPPRAAQPRRLTRAATIWGWPLVVISTPSRSWSSRPGGGLRGMPRRRGRWVHLRMCQSCGHIGCCDNSPGRHATAHHAATGHPIIRSAEPGEDWSWCYVDELMFRLR